MHFIEEEVIRLVTKHKTRDPFELCRLEKIECLINDMHDDMNGMYQYEKRNRIVHINNSLVPRDRTLTCAHELAHAVLHTTVNCRFLKNYTYLSTNKYERQANMFVAVLEIEHISREMFYEKTIEEVALEFAVPVELVMFRIEVARLGGYF